jgi:alkyl hydroperoxide reductase subunit AhpC
VIAFVDGLESHMEWIKDIEEVQMLLQYPIIADESKEVANLYDMIHPNKMKFNTFFFIIGPDKIKLSLTYPATGRNFDEILRVIDSLQLTADYKVATRQTGKMVMLCFTGY